MMADMLELIARLEAAEVGSRELDGLIAREFGWHRVEPRFARNKHGGWIAPEDFIGLYSDGSPKLDGLHGTTIHRDSPRLTTSLDAALALAERVLPDHMRGPITLCIAGTAEAYVDHVDPCGDSVKAFGKSPALALCIAILRAIQHGYEAAGEVSPNLKAKAQGEGG